MQIMATRGVRIALISGSSLENSLRWPLSLCSTEVSVHIATISNSELFLCRGPSNFLSIDRSENVVVWPPFNTHLNCIVSSVFSSPALPACFNTHVSLGLHIHFGFCCVSTLQGANGRTRIPFGIALLDMSADRFIRLS